MRRQSDAPLGQIEAELMPHRTAQPRIDARRGRPHAFDKSAENNAIAFGEAGFERAVDAKPRCRQMPRGRQVAMPRCPVAVFSSFFAARGLVDDVGHLA